MPRGKPLSFDREKVLSEALTLFWQKGFHNTGMSQLLAHLGIQRQSFYNTFGSKEKIYLEAVTLYAQDVNEEIIAVLDQPGNPLDNVRQVLDMEREMVPGADAKGCLLGNAMAEFGTDHPKVSALLKEKIGQLEKAYTRTFSKAIQMGLLPETKDPSAMAQTLIAMTQGMALLSRLGYGEEMVFGVVNLIEDLITD